ncbi:MAG: DNA polymerase ligase N-terminal domain-containing protein [Candidatus Thermoplasmatota archaeon]|nr:DNA polymerase ligase N-terminal domain-containing protein [Candidatus Thermoplasmatota archaeon]
MRFVVHEHQATHHHFDFRLEMDGVAKSWAVPKKIPTGRGEKRLAVQVEDHSIDYMSFEGHIPEGRYGAGEVSIWDQGDYQMEERSPRGMKFVLRGQRLDGRYVLIPFPKAGDNAWLMIKE